MAVGIAVAIVVATRLQVFRQATAERVRRFAAVGVYIELEVYFVTPWQFLVPGDVVVSADSPVFVQAAVVCAVDQAALPCRVVTFRGAVAVAVAHVIVDAQFDGYVEYQVVVGIKPEVLLPRPRPRAAEDVTAVGKAFAGGACLVVGIAPCQCGIEAFLHVLVLVLSGEVESHLLGRAQSLRLVGRRPVALVARLSVFVDVVGVGEGRQSRMVGVVETEETAQIAVVGAQSALYVCQQAAIVLTFQDYVHHIVFLLHLFAFPLAVFR